MAQKPLTLKDVVGKIRSTAGSENSASMSLEVPDCERVPTTLIPLDLALGGGIPRGAQTMIWGGESSGKTNLALKLIATAQHKWPDSRCVFVDIEHELDKAWAAKLGVDVERLVYMRPIWGEEAVNWIEASLLAEDCSMLVIDSIADLEPKNTIEKDAGRQNVAGNSALVTRMQSKIIAALEVAQQAGRHTTLVSINQMRYHVGMVYGNPEKAPGGKKLHHACRLILKTEHYAKESEIDSRVSDGLYAVRATRVTVTKNKLPILNRQATYRMVMLPHDGYEVGDSANDWPTLVHYLRELGWMKAGGFDLLGRSFAKQSDLQQEFQEDPDYLQLVVDSVIEALFAKLGVR